jgi:DNA-binding transcriptional ArsR family regulator
MAIAEERETRSRRVIVGASTVSELFWATVSVMKPSLRASHPELARVFETNPQLAGHVEDIWRTDDTCFDELILLANHAGVLEGSPDRSEALEAIRLACDHDFTGIDLASEDAERRHELIDRLDRLRVDNTLRDAYLRLIDELWAAVEPALDRLAPMVDAGIRRMERRIASGRPLRELMPEHAAALLELTPELATRNDRDWFVAVAAFAGKCGALDLPGLVWCSFAEDELGEDRLRADELGRQLRAIADPTRMSILRLLTTTPLRIGELATALAVSQPTVSNHVKVLREGGVLRSENRGGRQELIVDHEALSQLLAEVGELVGAGARADIASA